MTEYPTFRALCLAMRQAQKQYFRDRTQSALRAALKLELRVDAWLERHGDAPAEQLPLDATEAEHE